MFSKAIHIQVVSRATFIMRHCNIKKNLYWNTHSQHKQRKQCQIMLTRYTNSVVKPRAGQLGTLFSNKADSFLLIIYSKILNSHVPYHEQVITLTTLHGPFELRVQRRNVLFWNKLDQQFPNHFFKNLKNYQQQLHTINFVHIANIKHDYCLCQLLFRFSTVTACIRT